MDVPDLDDALIDKIASQSDAHSGAYSVRELERIRDRNLVGFLEVLKQHHWGAGNCFVDWTNNLRKTADKIARDTSKQALSCYQSDVLPAWIDYNGHMTEYRYLQIMSEATDVLLGRMGVDANYLAGGHSFFTVETHIRHLDEAKLGDRLTVSLQVLQAEAKKLHIFQTVTQQDGVIVATGEQMCLHVNLQSSRAVPMQSPVAEAFAELAAAHQSLGMPEGAGRSIGAQK
jgi:carnitine 3-dehydrogenase